MESNPFFKGDPKPTDRRARTAIACRCRRELQVESMAFRFAASIWAGLSWLIYGAHWEPQRGNGLPPLLREGSTNNKGHQKATHTWGTQEECVKMLAHMLWTCTVYEVLCDMPNFGVHNKPSAAFWADIWGTPKSYHESLV